MKWKDTLLNVNEVITSAHAKKTELREKVCCTNRKVKQRAYTSATREGQTRKIVVSRGIYQRVETKDFRIQAETIRMIKAALYVKRRVTERGSVPTKERIGMLIQQTSLQLRKSR